MSRLAPLVDPLAGENGLATAPIAAGKGGGDAPPNTARRAALADVSNRRAAAVASATPAGKASQPVPGLGGTALKQQAQQAQQAQHLPQQQAARAPATVGAAPRHAPAALTAPFRVLSDADAAPTMEALAGRSGAAEEVVAEAASAAAVAARVAALAAGAVRYPAPPLSEAARAAQALRAFTVLDEEELPRPLSPCGSPGVLLPAACGACSPSGGLAGLSLDSPPSSSVADWGGSTPPASATSGSGNGGEADAACPSTSSPTLARALAALDLGGEGGGRGGAAFGDQQGPPGSGADLAACLADWDAALAGVDGNSPASGGLLEVDGEWDGAVSPPQAEGGGGGGSGGGGSPA